MRRIRIVLSLVCCATAPALACPPALDPVTLTPADAREAVTALLNRSVVVVDGTIEWSPAAWKAQSTGRGRGRLPIWELYPTVRVARSLKGPWRPSYKVSAMDRGDCGVDPTVEYLPPGTPVRLLLKPADPIGRFAIWSVLDTSWSGLRENERRVNAVIDDLLGIARDPRAASLVDEPPPPSE